jgi:hypothetical protein
MYISDYSGARYRVKLDGSVGPELTDMKSTLRRYIIYFEGVCALFIRKWTALDARANLIICHGIGEHSGRYDAFAFS